jgi:hypothetical protein
MASRRLFDGAQAGLGPLPVVTPADGGILAGAGSVGGSVAAGAGSAAGAAQADGRGTAVRPAAGGAVWQPGGAWQPRLRHEAGMSDIFHMAPRDTLWALGFFQDDTAIDLTGASVTFTLVIEVGVTLFTRTAQVQIATVAPCLRYLWQTGDKAIEG